MIVLRVCILLYWIVDASLAFSVVNPSQGSRRKPFALNMFDFKSGDETKKDTVKSEAGEEEDDLSSWVSGLGQWPLPPPANTATQPSLAEKGRFRAADSFPLTSILNMEALLAFATGERGGSTASPTSAMTQNNTLPNSTNLTFLDELSDWDKWVGGLKVNIGDLPSPAFGRSGDILRQATARIESLLVVASSAVSPLTIKAMVRQASEIIQNTTAAKNLLEAAAEIVLERGLEAGEAAERERDTKAFTADFVAVADGILRKGYVEGDQFSGRRNDILSGLPAMPGSRPLFENYESAVEINTLSPVIAKDAEMAALAGAVYE